MALDPTVQGALIALGGVAVSQIATAIIEWRREVRTDRREAERRRQVEDDRIFEHRRDAYTRFAQMLWDWRNNLLNQEIIEGDWQDPDFDTFDPLYDALTVVRLYGSTQSYERGLAALEAMSRWISTRRSERRAPLVAFDNAREAFIESIRHDLGVLPSRTPALKG